jgi:hypothetical protein
MQGAVKSTSIDRRDNLYPNVMIKRAKFLDYISSGDICILSLRLRTGSRITHIQSWRALVAYSRGSAKSAAGYMQHAPRTSFIGLLQ